MVDATRVPKDMKRVLEEHSINKATLKADDRQIILAKHIDVINEKNCC